MRKFLCKILEEAKEYMDNANCPTENWFVVFENDEDVYSYIAYGATPNYTGTK